MRLGPACSTGDISGVEGKEPGSRQPCRMHFVPRCAPSTEETRTGSCSLFLFAELLPAHLYFGHAIQTLPGAYPCPAGSQDQSQSRFPCFPWKLQPLQRFGLAPGHVWCCPLHPAAGERRQPQDSFRLLSGRLGPGFLPSSASPQCSAPKSGPGGCAAAAAATLLFPWKHGEGWLGCHAASAGAGAQGSAGGCRG